MSKPTDLERATTAEALVKTLTADLEKSKADHQVTANSLAAEVLRANGLAADLTLATNEKVAAETALEKANEQITHLKSVETSGERKAAAILSSVGANPVPDKTGGSAVADSLEDLTAQFRAETNSDKRHVLAAKIRAMRDKKKAA